MAIKSDGRDRAAARELQVGEPRARAAAAVHAAGRHRDGGRAARASTEATYAMLDAIGPIYRGAEPVVRRARAPATAGRSAATPRSRTRSPNNIVFQAGRRPRDRRDGAGLGLPLGARADDGDRAAERRAEAAVRPHGRAAGPRDRRDPARACRAPRSTARCARTTTSTASGRTGATTSGTRSASATTRARSSTAATTTEIRPGMVFTVEPGLYAAGARRLPPLRHGRRHRRRRRVADVLPARPREPDAPGVTDAAIRSSRSADVRRAAVAFYAARRSAPSQRAASGSRRADRAPGRRGARDRRRQPRSACRDRGAASSARRARRRAGRARRVRDRASSVDDPDASRARRAVAAGGARRLFAGRRPAVRHAAGPRRRPVRPPLADRNAGSRTTKEPPLRRPLRRIDKSAATYSPGRLPSEYHRPWRGLTSLFGMGRGVSPPV